MRPKTLKATSILLKQESGKSFSENSCFLCFFMSSSEPRAESSIGSWPKTVPTNPEMMDLKCFRWSIQQRNLELSANLTRKNIGEIITIFYICQNTGTKFNHLLLQISEKRITIKVRMNNLPLNSSSPNSNHGPSSVSHHASLACVLVVYSDIYECPTLFMSKASSRHIKQKNTKKWIKKSY